MEVEGFTGPAGSDGAGVGMLDTVYGSELIVSGLVIMLGLLCAAEREVQMSGQVRIVDPRVAGTLVNTGKYYITLDRKIKISPRARENGHPHG